MYLPDEIDPRGAMGLGGKEEDGVGLTAIRSMLLTTAPAGSLGSTASRRDLAFR